jgi:phage shock protein PspC (stress-responsive transcriptional regulator)
MSTTPPDAPPADPAQGPRASREELRDLGSIRRTVGPQRKVAGVAGGLARHLDVDPIILRVALVVLVFFGGAGLLLYAAGWVLIPEDGTDRAPLALDDRSRSVALIVFGAIGAVAFLGDGLVGGFGVPWPLIAIAAVALVVLVFVDRDRPGRPVPTAPPVPHTYDSQAQAMVPAQPGTFSRPLSTPVTPYVAAAPTYSATTYGTTAYPTYVGRPRNPRKRGPILFWFTLFAAALAAGVLGIVDLAGVDVAPAAYPALVTGVFAVMLLVGSVWGRAGGLILVGLLAAVGTGVTAVASTFDPETIERTPTTAVDVPDSIDVDAGQVVLDLSDVQDVAALDGRALDLRADLGSIRVILPPGLSANVDARVDGGGSIELFDRRDNDGFNVESSDTYDAGPGTPEIDIDAHVGFGEVRIWTETQP